MGDQSVKKSFFSDLCIDKCKGRCCDPWWGIVSFPVKKEQGLSHISDFRKNLSAGIKERAGRIREGYVTHENPPRQLFDSPLKYNVSIEDIRISGLTITLVLRAMFAFRCRFMSPENSCAIHPAVIGGADIRPTHCGYMGSLDAEPDDKGYCRIIHTAKHSPDDNAVDQAIDFERRVSDKFYKEGVPSIEDAVDLIVEQVKGYCRDSAPHLLPVDKSAKHGRNDPCHCGSGKKYKKCHGRP